MGKLKGVHAPHMKNTAACEPEAIPIPKQVRLPMSMHSGAPAKPVVSVGDEVKVGQLIGEADGRVSAPVHASVSGKVLKIDDSDPVTGTSSVSIVIESDGLQTEYDGLVAPTVTNLDEFVAAVRDSGTVGLGGAGYPTAPKFDIKDPSKFEYIIVNGAECEPYVTADTRAMIDDAALVRDGILLMQKYLKVPNTIIGIESNKPEAIRVMQDITADIPGVKVHTLRSLYPRGSKSMIIYETTRRIAQEGGRSADLGVILINCSTLASVARYINTGMPLVSRCVTVDGSAVKTPKNVIAPIGTPVSELFDYCGGFKEEPKKVLLGGPMMGDAIPDLSMPIVKTTGSVLAFTAKDVKKEAETACIRCGRCVNHCPMGLMPLEIETAYNLKKPELLEKYKANMCMECGCCAYSCPAKRPLVQVIKLAKIMLRDYQAAQKAAAQKKEAKTGE